MAAPPRLRPARSSRPASAFDRHSAALQVRFSLGTCNRGVPTAIHASMKLRSLLACPLIIVGAVLCARAALAAPAAAAHWEYSGPHGTSHWAALDPAYEACAKGREQSPID